MEVAKLALPERIIEILGKEGITELNDPQAKAVKKGLLEGKNLVIASPTASGKTLIAELAILKKFLAGEKSVYLVPLKALASEKFDDFNKKYKDLGMRIAISTGDYDSGDDWLGGYDLVILSNEKMDSVLRHSPKWITNISLIVSDEVHLINDVGRGPTLEIVLTKLRQITSSQILALSATIENSNEIAKWLNAALVYSEYRPIKLRKGVCYPDDSGFVIDFEDKKEGIKKIAENEVSLCMNTLERGKQALIFVSTRRNAEAAAEKIARQLEKHLSDQEKKRLKEIADEAQNALSSPTKQCRRLAGIMEKGVAFHHAGLVAKQRKLIETGFSAGKIKFIVATPTLAFGVNLPAYRVLIRDAKRYDFSYGSSYIPNFEIQQMMGRAGRPKYDSEGEAILIAKNEKEADDMRERYIFGELEPIFSKLSSEPVLRMHVLSLIASETASTRKGLENFFSRTFFAHQYGDIQSVMAKIDKILDELASFKFIKYGDDEKFISSEFKPAFSLTSDVNLKATRIGKRVAELYIDPLSAKFIIDNIEIKNPLGYMTVICQCAEMFPRLRVKSGEDIASKIVSMNMKVPDAWDVEYEDFLEAYKTALMFRDWTNEIGEDRLLEKYDIAPGELYTKSLNADWMLFSAKELAIVLGKNDAANILNKLRLRIKYGVKEELIELVSLRGIGRVRARILWENGVKDIASLRKAPEQKINKLLGTALARQVSEQINEDKYEKFSRLKKRNRKED